MNNFHDLAHTVNVINTTAIPHLYDILKNLYLHVGEYKLSTRTEDFAGWLLCDGRSLSRTRFKHLYDIIGTAFGAEDSDSFSLPDYRGRVMGFTGQSDNLSNRNLGVALGEESHVLTSNEMPGHIHTATASTDGAHTHTGSTGVDGAHTHTINDPGHTHSQTTINDDFNNSGTNPPGFSSDSAGTRVWNNINTATTGITINSSTNHTHTIASDGNHTHTITINSTGGNQGHNNMQPTLFGGNVFIFCGFLIPELTTV
jgi:microcystin-dependent protein